MDDSLLIRSAESLGRMIGSLQRQLDGASKKLNETSGGFAGVFGVDGRSDGNGSARATGGVTKSRTKTARAKAADKGASKSGATKVRSTADRKSTRAAKSAGAKKSAGRSRSGASRASARKSTKRT
jgi:hypothetical protein